jgi:hypothetical protein
MAFGAADLQMVDDHIIQGERHVTRQEELVQWLRERGLPTVDAESLLEDFKATLIQHRAHRDMMLRDAASG